MTQQAIGQGVVEIVAEASGFRASIAELVAEATRGGQAVGKAVSEGAAKAADGLELLDSKVNRWVNSVTREIATIDLSRAAYRAWEAQTKGIPNNVYLPLIAKLDEVQRKRDEEAQSVKDAARAAAEAARAQAEEAAALARSNAQREAYLAGLREKIALTGADADATERYRAAQAGASTQADGLINDLTRMRAAHAAAAQAAKDHADAEARAARTRNDNEAFVNSLQRQASAIGKTRSQLLEMEAAQRGVTAAAAPHIAALRAQEAAAEGAARGLGVAGLSQKQYNAALRGVPAQITDIVVSLQGGQAPITVLLQQGGQLKDMFNGIVPAIKALSIELLKLATNPVVLVTAGIAALSYAYYKGSQESDNYVKSLALTGERAGVTAAQLNSLAASIAAVRGTQGAAAEALSSIVSAGGVSGVRDLARYAETAIIANKRLGMSVEDVAKTYADLAKDPVQASERLTEQMGYLTLAQYNQIRALVEAGDKTKAAEVAQRAYDDAVRAAAASVEANLGTIQRAWQGLTGYIKEATDAAMAFGRTPTPEQRQSEYDKRLQSARGFTRFFGNDTAERQITAERRAEDMRNLRQMDNAMAEAAAKQLETEKLAAQKRVENLEKSTRSRAQIRADEIAAMRRDYALLGKTEAEKLAAEKAINDKFKDKRVAAPKQFQNDAGVERLKALEQEGAALKSQLEATDKLTRAEAAREKFIKEIAFLQSKPILEADEKAILAAETKLSKQYDLNVEYARGQRYKEDQAKQDAKSLAAITAYEQAILRITSRMDSNKDMREDALGGLVGTFGRGDRARERSEEERRLRREFERDIRAANAAGITAGGTGADEADIANIRKRHQEALGQLREYYDTENRLRGDWSQGYTRAFENYYDSATDVASQVENAFTRSLSAVEDAFVTVAQTGKISFSGLANSIIADVIRIQVRMAMANALGSSGGGLLGIIGSLVPRFFGASTGGAGVGTYSSGNAASFDVGGYTGPGGKHQYAGVVHKGEVVWSQDDVRNAGGVDIVERLRRGMRGYMNGGVVGGPAAVGGGGGFGRVIINNYGAEVETEQRPNGQGGLDLVVIARQVGQVLGGDLAAGVGPIANAGQQRYGWRTTNGR